MDMDIGLGQIFEKIWTVSLEPMLIYFIDKSWTIMKNYGQSMDNYLTKLSKISIILTNIGHWQNLDKTWTIIGQNFDICQKFVQTLSNHQLLRSTVSCLSKCRACMTFCLSAILRPCPVFGDRWWSRVTKSTREQLLGAVTLAKTPILASNISSSMAISNFLTFILGRPILITPEGQ